MGKNVTKEITVRKLGHVFCFYVMDSGKVEYSIDNGAAFAVKEIADGKVRFVTKQEIVVKGELVEIGSLSLSDADFASLKGAQEATLRKMQKQAARKLDGDHAKKDKERKEALRRVDSWKHKVSTYKDKAGNKQKYCIHNFRIGDNKYRFTERDIPGSGVIINPDYKVSREMPDVGGVPKRYGELIFWDYFFEGEDWRRVRVLTNNELICLDIIQKYGFFSGTGDPEE